MPVRGDGGSVGAEEGGTVNAFSIFMLALTIFVLIATDMRQDRNAEAYARQTASMWAERAALKSWRIVSAPLRP